MWLYEYGWIIAVIVGMVGYFTWLYQKKGKEVMVLELREHAYSLMLAAEKKFNQGEGEIKFSWVVEHLYLKLPKSLTLFINQDELETYLQVLYLDMKDYLDDGELNNSQ